MNVKIEEKYNAVVLELKGKLMGGPFMQEMNETLHKLIDEGKKNREKYWYVKSELFRHINMYIHIYT